MSNADKELKKDNRKASYTLMAIIEVLDTLIYNERLIDRYIRDKQEEIKEREDRKCKGICAELDKGKEIIICRDLKEDLKTYRKQKEDVISKREAISKEVDILLDKVTDIMNDPTIKQV